MNNDFNNQNGQGGNFYNSGGNFYNPNGQQQGGNFYNPNGQSFYDPYSQNQALGMQKANTAKTMGIAALICSLLSVCISPLIALVLGILAIVNASTARRLIGFETAETKSARTFGIISLVITGVIFVLSIAFSILYIMLIFEGL